MGKFELDQIDNIIDELLDFTGDRTAQLAGNLVVQLKKETPRDTSLAGSSWVAERGPRLPGRLPPRNPVGLGRAKSQQAQSLARLKTYKIEHGAIFVGNPLPYIRPLDEGHSSQQPRPFVGRVVSQVVSAANRKK